jgi:transposase InsO family protein
MLNKAFAKLGPRDKPILHSDQGWQYQMPVYSRRLKQQKVRQSMSRKGNCLDNATMESFFGTLKSAFFYLNKFRNLDELNLHAILDHFLQSMDSPVDLLLKLRGIERLAYHPSLLPVAQASLARVRRSATWR